MRLFAVLFALTVTLTSAQVFNHPNDQSGEARDRTVDILHYKIDLSFDEAKKMVIGKTTTTFVPFGTACTSVEFDAEDITFKSITVGKKNLSYDSLAKSVRIRLDRAYSFKETVAVTMEYTALPKRGVYFVQPDSGYPNKPWQIWTQGEDMDNHHWFPCWDFPNDKSTSEVTATVKNAYTFLSNGHLVSDKENKKEGTRTVRWVQDKPHSSYLIMFAAGEYAVLKEKADGIPLEYYVYKNHVEDAKACYAPTPSIMKFFNEKIGFKYAWDKYAQVIVADFVYGGMENTSATTLMDRITVYNARARVDESAASLIAHEMAHQWWGDVLTCKDWRHLWLNESFASYFDPLYFEYANGVDEFRNQMYQAQMAGVNTDKQLGRKPIVSVGSYGANIYPRGASVLHMLRFVLGDTLFWRSINQYITKNQFRPVETNDLKRAVEETTGQNLYWFFDQWVYKAGYPKFEVTYAYNDSAKNVAVTVKQTQTVDSLTGIFFTPVNVEVVTAAGSSVHRITISQKESTYVLPAASVPSLVLFDKDDWILKEVSYPGRSMKEWMTQAEKGSDVVARRTAAAELAKIDTTGESIALLAKIATTDPFWGVRQAAVNALGTMKMKNEVKKNALLAALTDKKSQVRASAATQLGTLKGADIAAALRTALKDSSYSTEANALAALARVDSANALPELRARLDEWSYGNQVANAALNGIARVDSSEAIATALKKVRYGAEALGRNTALGVLRRVGKKRPDVLATAVTLAQEKSGGIRYSAVDLLGENGDSTHIPVLQSIADKKEEGISAAAQKSIEKIKEKMKK